MKNYSWGSKFPLEEKPPEIVKWGSRLKRRLWLDYAEARSSHVRPAKRLVIASLVAKWIAAGGGYFLPADKAGELVLVSLNDLCDAHRELLDASCYTRLSHCDLEVLDPHLFHTLHVKPTVVSPDRSLCSVLSFG